MTGKGATRRMLASLPPYVRIIIIVVVDVVWDDMWYAFDMSSTIYLFI